MIPVFRTNFFCVWYVPGCKWFHLRIGRLCLQFFDSKRYSEKLLIEVESITGIEVESITGGE